MSDRKFWAIWGKSIDSAPPKRQYDTEQEAMREAERLTALTGDDYYILEVIGVIRPIQVPVEYVEIINTSELENFS